MGGIPSLSEQTGHSNENIPFSDFETKPTGGPKKLTEKVIDNVNQYKMFMGDIDPGFNPGNTLHGVDFGNEVLIGVALGEVQEGTTVRIRSIRRMDGGVTDGLVTIHYTVTPPSGQHIAITAEPYTLVKCTAFTEIMESAFIRDDF